MINVNRGRFGCKKNSHGSFIRKVNNPGYLDFVFHKMNTFYFANSGLSAFVQRLVKYEGA